MDHNPAAPDLEPLAKRARLDIGDTAMPIAHSPIVGVLEQDGDDADSDFYGDDAPRLPVAIANGVVCADSPQTGDRGSDAPGGGCIPGLLMMDQSIGGGGDGNVSDSKDDDEVSRQLAVEHVAAHDIAHDDTPNTIDSALSLQTETATPYTNPAEPEAAPASEDVVMGDSGNLSEAVTREEEDGEEEEGEVLETIENPNVAVDEKEDGDEGPRLEADKQAETKKNGEDDVAADVVGDAQDTAANLLGSLSRAPTEEKSKPSPDPDFLALAAAQKGDKSAEWQYDTSDAETSSDSSALEDDSEDDSEDDPSEEGYVGMKPEDIAKVLMQEDFNEGGPSTGAGPLRTKNEVPEDEEKVERPDIIVTPEMKIEELGKVETIIDNMVLVKAITSGEYQVLSEGSLLVLEDRSVIGIVADTLGRVEEPLYTVRFNSADEVKELKVVEGGNVFYVPAHSTYVFTKPLLAQKGTDASNLYDEEPAESEQEYSDDEAEARHKKRKKEGRKATNGDKSGDRNNDRNVRNKNFKGNKKPWVPPEPPAPVGPATLNYDEPYVPLQRPANLHEMASQPPPPLPSSLRGRGRSGKGDRGERGGFRSRGNDRGGRGGRGRGNDGRGRGGNDRGGRGRGYDRGPGGDRGDRGDNRGDNRGDRGGDRGDRSRGGYDRGGKGGRGGRDQGGRNRDRDDRDRDQGGRDDSRNRSPRAHRDQFKGQHRDDRADDYYHKQRDRQGQQQNQQDQSSQGYPPPPPPQAMPQFTGFAAPQPQSPGIQGTWQQPVFPGFQQFPMGFQFPAMPPIPPPPPQHAGTHPSFFGNTQVAAAPPQQQQPAQVPAWMQGFVPQQQSYPPQQASNEDAFRALQQTLALLKQGQQQQQQQQPQ